MKLQRTSCLCLHLCRRYGSLFALYVGPHYTVVVNDHQHAREVLQQRGKDFAGRPSMVRLTAETSRRENIRNLNGTCRLADCFR